MSEEKCNFYNKIYSCERCELGSILYKGKSNYKYHIDCKQNDNCYYKQLKTAKEENEKLKGLIRKLAIDKIEFDRLKRNETDKVDYSFGQIETLTQQNKQMREALKAISKAHSETVPRIMKYAQQALGMEE